MLKSDRMRISSKHLFGIAWFERIIVSCLACPFLESTIALLVVGELIHVLILCILSSSVGKE